MIKPEELSKNEHELNQKLILDWASPVFPLAIRAEAAQVYIDYINHNPNPLLDYYLHPLTFGTGGLRGIIGNGSGRMNIWTVGKTTTGMCDFLKKKFGKKASLVIAHDSRRMSPEFAQTVAGIAANCGLKVHLFKGVTPTPILSYAIRYFKASGGVVITASHNPPEYNGYKVYLSDGSQLVGSDQSKLEKAINKIEDWSQIPFLDSGQKLYKQKVQIVKNDLKNSYLNEFKKTLFISGNNKTKKDFKIVYSPLHGTGGPWMPVLLKKYGFHLQMVKEQAEPDGEFSTVKFPNPEEKEALKLSEELSKKIGADLFLATDPDADRLGAGVRLQDGSYELLNGNQVGSIMCAWLCEKTSQNSQSKKSNQSKSSKKTNWHVMKTIVTTQLQSRIADNNGIKIHNVLTGFKYIAEQMRDIEENKKGFTKNDSYLFGGEESYGYLPVDFVRDKDALASALLLCEIMASVGNLNDYLNQIYLKYGLFLEDLKAITLKGSAGLVKINNVLNNLRQENMIGLKLGERIVTGFLDYQTQSKNNKPDKKTFGKLPKANVIQLELEPFGTLTIRPSGTEPKVKLYASLAHPGELGSLEELKTARKKLEDELALISGHFFSRTGLA